LSEIDLFGEIGDIVFPKANNEEGITGLDIEGALASEMVESVLLPTEEVISVPNYVIDLGAIEEVDPIQIGVLDSFIVETPIAKDINGSVAIYILIQNSIQKIGYGDDEVLGRIIAKAIESAFGSECKVYKDYKVNEKPVVYGSKDVTKLRLNI